jgi:hypothetical protein
MRLLLRILFHVLSHAAEGPSFPSKSIEQLFIIATVMLSTNLPSPPVEEGLG